MHGRLTELQDITAEELTPEDYILVSDVWDKEAKGSVSKRMQVDELMKYIREHFFDYGG